MESAMALSVEPQVHLWTHDEYLKMAEIGLFEGRRVELIEGQVIEMTPMGSEHITCITLADDALRKVFNTGYFIRIQGPLDVGELSEPEPDLAVIAGHVRDYRKAHPTTAALIIEVADTTLAYDRRVKTSLYAKVGIREYWIINLNDRQLEVYRTPVRDAAQRFGFGYADKQIVKANGTVTPLAAPQAVIAVADLLP